MKTQHNGYIQLHDFEDLSKTRGVVGEYLRFKEPPESEIHDKHPTVQKLNNYFLEYSQTGQVPEHASFYGEDGLFVLDALHHVATHPDASPVFRNAARVAIGLKPLDERGDVSLAEVHGIREHDITQPNTEQIDLQELAS